jgi:hypothetical protein
MAAPPPRDDDLHRHHCQGARRSRTARPQLPIPRVGSKRCPMRRGACNSTPAYRNVVTSEDSAVRPAGLFVEPGAKVRRSRRVTLTVPGFANAAHSVPPSPSLFMIAAIAREPSYASVWPKGGALQSDVIATTCLRHGPSSDVRQVPTVDYAMRTLPLRRCWGLRLLQCGQDTPPRALVARRRSPVQCVTSARP